LELIIPAVFHHQQRRSCNWFDFV